MPPLSTVTLAFDFDGTLVDSLHASITTFRQACEYVGADAAMIDTSREAFVGYFKGNVFEQLLATGVAPGVLKSVLDQLQVLQREAYATVEAFEGCVAALREVSQLSGEEEVTLACVSSNREAVIIPWFERHAPDLCGRIHMLGAEAGHDKQQKLKRFIPDGETESSVIFVTDTIGDVQEGVAAGVHVVGVEWGWHDSESLTNAGAHDILASSKKLSADLQQVVSARCRGH